jgi:hypothetical protein
MVNDPGTLAMESSVARATAIPPIPRDVSIGSPSRLMAARRMAMPPAMMTRMRRILSNRGNKLLSRSLFIFTAYLARAVSRTYINR